MKSIQWSSWRKIQRKTLHLKIDTKSLTKRMLIRESLESSMKIMPLTLTTVKSIKKCTIWPKNFNLIRNNWLSTKLTQSSSSRMKPRKTHLSNNSIKSSMKNIWIKNWHRELMKNIKQIQKTMTQASIKMPISWLESLISMKNNWPSTKSIPWSSSSKKPKKMLLWKNSMRNSTKRTLTETFKEVSMTMETLTQKMNKTMKATELQET